MNKHLQVETLFDAKTIRQRVESLAVEIAPRLNADALVVGVLQGAFVFTADLIRALSVAGAQVNVDFLRLSSYGTATASSGRVQVRMDCQASLQGRQVLIVDTVLDSGTTLAFAQTHLRQKKVGELLSCVLLDKTECRQQPVDVDFIGFTIPNHFVVGYGVDAADQFRELPFIGHVKHD